jgi:beta-1,3-N-acetylglucosaminyltransferase 5
VYGAGTAYVFSSEVADKVHEVSQALNSILYIDDVFMGLCDKKMGIVAVYHMFFLMKVKLIINLAST